MKKNGMTRGFVVWFTGLSGAGKSTLAAMLSAEIRGRGVHVEVLDGDEVRTHLSKGLGFSKEDRDTNIRRIGYVAKLVARSGACAMTAAISPYSAIRDEQRAQIGRFVEVYCRCDIATLANRDAKGLYKKALAGEIKGFTGVDDPYEAPDRAEVVVDTATETKEESLAKIVAKLEELGYIATHSASPTAMGPAASSAGAKLIAPHGGELVDRFVKARALAALQERAPVLPAVLLDERAASDVEMIAVGAFSPLTGFMNQKDYLRVVRDMRLERGLPWSMPVTLAVSEERCGQAPCRLARRAPHRRRTRRRGPRPERQVRPRQGARSGARLRDDRFEAPRRRVSDEHRPRLPRRRHPRPRALGHDRIPPAPPRSRRRRARSSSSAAGRPSSASRRATRSIARTSSSRSARSRSATA